MVAPIRFADTIILCAQQTHAFHLRQAWCWSQALLSVERNMLAELGCADNDRDLVCDFRDNCATLYNPWQRDTDGDGVADACDRDLDNDGVPNAIDPQPHTPNRPATVDDRSTPRSTAQADSEFRELSARSSPDDWPRIDLHA